MGFVVLAGRIFLSIIFILSGIMKFTNYAGQVAYAESMGLPMAGIAIIIAGLVEVLGGAAVLTGFKARTGAWLLFLYLIPTTIIFHTEFGDQNQVIHFLKNLAIMGGLLVLAGWGPGKKTLGR